VTPGPPAAEAGDDDRVTPIGARRTSVADLQREVERLTQALALAEARSQPPPRSRVRTVRRLLLLAGLVLGMALLVDGILTIVWQEPITALQQSRDQGALRTDLKELQQTLAAAPQVARESSTARIRRQALTLLQAKRPDGSALGSVDIPRIGLKTVFVESTDHQALKKGPGHYRGTVLPGLYGTVGLAGHRTTYGAPFRRVDELSPGSRIVLRMPYGRFTYKVTGTRITTPADASSLVSRAGSRRLVLTACHPLYSAAKRIVVSARLVSATPA
jgi:sortase A